MGTTGLLDDTHHLASIMDWRQTSLALFIGSAALMATVFFGLLRAASKGILPEPGETMVLVIIGGGILLLAVWLSTR